jgi:ligand-binding SRPBCC domain-containing protein
MSARADVAARGLRFESAGGPTGRYYLLRCQQWVAAGIEECFAFFADAANLEALTPPSLHFGILTPLPIRMRTGAHIESRLRLLGVPFSWLTRIEDWRPGLGFTDTQLRGPYRRWVHRHTFAAAGGGTSVRDDVEYQLPLAPWSDLVHTALVRPQLRHVFACRQDVIVRLLG